VKRQDETRVGKVVEAFFFEDEAAGFAGIEALIREAKPEFGKEWEERLFSAMSRKGQRGFFYMKSLVAACLLIVAVSLSLVFFGGGMSRQRAAGATVSAALVSDLVSSFDGKVDSDFDDVFSAVEEKFNAASSGTDAYIKEVIGGNDENDIS